MTPAILMPLQQVARPTVDVVVIPGAGVGPAVFRSWQGLIPAGWRLTGICLPGRAARYDEPGLPSVQRAADEVVAGLTAAGIGRPVLFGHSMGALVALEVARRAAVALLVTAACACPQPETPLSYRDIDEQAVRQEVREYTAMLGVADDGLLDELVDINKPVLLGDFAMMDGYAPDPRPVDCDIVSYYGIADDITPDSWSARSTGVARVLELAGDHYFPQQDPGPLLADLTRQLTSHSGAGREPFPSAWPGDDRPV
jgi:surfactin synthase thioesterase subunit